MGYIAPQGVAAPPPPPPMPNVPNWKKIGHHNDLDGSTPLNWTVENLDVYDILRLIGIVNNHYYDIQNIYLRFALDVKQKYSYCTYDSDGTHNVLNANKVNIVSLYSYNSTPIDVNISSRPRPGGGSDSFPCFYSCAGTFNGNTILSHGRLDSTRRSITDLRIFSDHIATMKVSLYTLDLRE